MLILVESDFMFLFYIELFLRGKVNYGSIYCEKKLEQNGKSQNGQESDTFYINF